MTTWLQMYNPQLTEIEVASLSRAFSEFHVDERNVHSFSRSSLSILLGGETNSTEFLKCIGETACHVQVHVY